MSTEFPENQPNSQVPDGNETNTDPSEDNDAKLDDKTQALLDELDDEIEDDGTAQNGATAELLQTLDQLKPQTLTPAPNDESMDGVPDEQQESTQFDTDVQAKIDVSDEEISNEEQNTSPVSERAVQEASDRVADTIQEQTPISPPPPPAENMSSAAIDIDQHYRYRIAISLPPLLQAAIDEALEEVGLIEDKQVGAFQWQAAFQCENPQAMAASLDQWVQENLPVPTKTERVHSAVIGTQTYIGGWTLSNSDSIYKAQEKLTAHLADTITPETDDDSTFHAILPVHTNVPPEHFPQLIGFLQRRFKPEAWKIEALELWRLPLDKKGNPEADATWSVMGTFRPEV